MTAKALKLMVFAHQGQALTPCGQFARIAVPAACRQ